ncbi:unnamed protein product [Paramecium primaurelia]|uniref:Uncharacterized protein n=1 Tax=Paramecium primaurelia TaxID=5886 RepID=A0A8S1PSK1_PARPR|nr:unnamed protein product [Paramecium primaurelia]
MFYFQIIIFIISNYRISYLLLQFLDLRLKYIHDTIIGFEFVSKEIKVQDQNITICIWETPGKLQSRFLTHIFYRVVQCNKFQEQLKVFLVFCCYQKILILRIGLLLQQYYQRIQKQGFLDFLSKYKLCLL